MNIKTYKLVPFSFFDKVGKDVEFTKNNIDSEQEVPDNSSRSVRDILESNLQDTNFEPSTHYTADFKLGKPSSPVEGFGHPETTFLGDSGILQKKNHNVKLKSIDQDLRELLNNDKISDDLKIKLYTILQRRYEHARNYTDQVKTDNDVDSLGENSPQRVLNDIILSLPNSKTSSGKNLAEILINEYKHIRWDVDGNIIFPKLSHLGAFDLEYLIRAILYSTSSEKHTQLAAKLVRPFLYKLQKKNVIGNYKLTEYMEKEKPISIMSKYVAW